MGIGFILIVHPQDEPEITAMLKTREKALCTSVR